MPALFTGQLHLSFYVATCILLKLPNGNAFYLSPGPQTLPADTLELNSHTKKKKKFVLTSSPAFKHRRAATIVSFQHTRFHK